MEKGIKSRRKILEVAFKLFATYSYPDVSYSLLEEATGISRGSMVYYFKNKEGIFSAVLDEFFYGASYVSALPSELRTSLKIFYNAAVNFYDANIRRMKAYQIPNVAEANLNIDHNAMQFIPEFKERELLALEEEKKVWEEVIRNSIASGELRADIDPKETALLFHTMSMGIFYSGAHEKTFPDAEPLRRVLERLYNAIRR